MNFLQRYEQFIKRENLFTSKDKLLLAVSGGVDSVVLCHLCKQSGYDFSIAHCNFQLRGKDSDRDEKFVQDLAKKYGVEFYVKTFDTNKIAKELKKSVEETARDLRYEWFNSIVNRPSSIVNTKDSVIPSPTPDSRLTAPDLPRHRRGSQLPTHNYILTAHHADDNIETVMMNFFRGTGIKGMRGILPKQNKIVRPLLFARREELEEYLQENKLEYVSDFTNLRDDYTRNYFRNKFIPFVTKHFPEAEENILSNINRLRDAELLYRQAIELHKKKLLEFKGNEIHIPVLKLKKSVPGNTILYEIIKDYDFSSQQVHEVASLLDSESGKYVASSTHRIIKNRNWLVIAPLETEKADTILVEGTGLWPFAPGKLQIEITHDRQPPASGAAACLDASLIHFPLLLRKWKHGDYFYPLGMKNPATGKIGKKKLARFFIDQKLSKTEKEKVWVLEMDKKILWVIGYRIDDRFKVTDKTREVLTVRLLISQTE